MTPPKPTPPSIGIPSPGDDEDWESSDVHESPPHPPARAPTSPGGYGAARARDDGGRATARKALAKIDELGRRFDEHAETMTRRFEEHAREDRSQFSKIDIKLDGQNDVLGDLRETVATNTAKSDGISTQLAGLTSELRLTREIEVRKQLQQHEAELADKTDTKAHERKVKFEWGRILPAILIAAVSALITAIATGKIP